MLTPSTNTFLRLYKYLFCVCIILLFSTACKKETGFISTNIQQEKPTARSYKAYIDSLSLVDSSAKHLSNTLIWNNLISLDLDSSKRLVYVPSALRTRTNIVNGLVFIESLEGDSIMQSFYTQIENLNVLKAVYRTAIEKYEVVESAKTIANYFTRTKSNFNGNIQFFTNRNKYLFTIGIENGTPSYFKAINKAKKGSKEGGIQANSDCVDYYLTTFYDDGSTETEFLFQSCTRDCIQTRIINISGETITTMACGDDNTINSGGGGGDGGVDLASIMRLLVFDRTSELIIIQSFKQIDGSTKYLIEDSNTIPFSTVTIIFKLNLNNQLIENEVGVDVRGLFDFNSNNQQIPLFSQKNSIAIPGTTEITFSNVGSMSFNVFSVFTIGMRMQVTTFLHPGSPMPIFSQIRYTSSNPFTNKFNK